MTGAMEILSVVLLAAISLSVFACTLLAGRADRLITTLADDADF